MHPEERHQAILRELRAQGSLRVSDFADKIGVSPITVRRDVETLAGRGLLTRVHGGATLQDEQPEQGAGLVIGMVVPSATYYYPEVIKGAREAAAAVGARLVLGISGYDGAQDRAQVQQLLRGGADGLLVTPTSTTADGLRLTPTSTTSDWDHSAPADWPDWLDALDVPVVLVERQAGAGQLEHVISDHVHGARLAVRHLAALGHRRIGLAIRHDTPTTPWLRRGYELGLADAELEPVRAAAVSSLLAGRDLAGFDYGRQADQLLAAVKDGVLTAALIHTDHDAIMLSQQLTARGLRVPEDLAIVAYDDEIAALADTPLTAIAPPKSAVGAAAVDLLVRRLTQPDRARQRVALLPELHIRSSCGA